MKTVWILERFVPREETLKSIAEFKEYSQKTDDLEEKKAWEKAIKKLEEKPVEGYWLGYVGRSNYKHFCIDAKDFIRRHKNDLVISGIRVVKGQIHDNEKTWAKYKNNNFIVNTGVLKYLYATL